MRRCLIIMLFLSFLSLPSVLWAADPIIGTWEINIAKSKMPSFFSTLTSQKEVYQELDSGNIKLTITRTFSDGKTEASIVSWPLKGGIAGSSLDEELVETLIAPGEWYVTRVREGKQYAVMHKVVSKDGKTYRLVITDTSNIDNGMPVELGVMIFDKQ